MSAASGSASWCSYGAASASNTFVTPSSLAAASATDLQSLPATSTCTSPPIALAAVSALLVASLRVLLSCSATRSVVISEHPRFVFKLADQFRGRSDFDPGFAPRRLSCFQYLQTWLDIHAISIRSFLIDRFFLCLHDVRQRRITRFVEPQICCDDRRHFQLDRLQPAVDFASHVDRVTFNRKLGRECSLRPVQQSRQHLSGLIAIVIDCLFPHDDQAWFFCLHNRLENLRYRKRLNRPLCLHQNAAVGTHSECGPDCLGSLSRSDRHRHDLRRLAGLFQSDRLLDRDLVEGIH